MKMLDIVMHSLSCNITNTLPAKPCEMIKQDQVSKVDVMEKIVFAHTCYLVPNFVFSQIIMIKSSFTEEVQFYKYYHKFHATTITILYLGHSAHMWRKL